MYEQEEPASKYAWIVYAIATIMAGGLMGYALASVRARPVATLPVANVGGTAPAPLIDEGQLRAYREILARDPGNVQAAVAAGNLLYDAHRYHEAIGFYQQAFAGNPSDVNVSTDLGTAFWYAGRPDEALAQYEKSLALNATHAQTLFNMGIVRSDGKNDTAGAIEAWERLLAANPSYPDAPRVRSLIVDARLKTQG